MTPDAARSTTAVHPGVDAQNPWLGLVAFTEDLQSFFHGRAEEADELLRRVERQNLTVLFGQSGLGKSSLLQAGLFPRLRSAGYLPVSIRLDHDPAAPRLSQQATAAARRAVVEAGGEWRSPDDEPQTLWEDFHRRGLRLVGADGRPVRLVLVFDQFEELFAIGQASDESRSRAAQFLTELADLVENRAPTSLEERLERNPELARQFDFDDPDHRVLVCLREDYLPHLESLRSSLPSIAENRMRLTRMNGERALEAVLNPGGSLIGQEVGRQVVSFVAGRELPRRAVAEGAVGDDVLAVLEVEPSLLSLVCRELNNRRLALGLSQITSDLLAGNRERILHDYYERCVADQPPGVRAFVEDELVTDSGLRENMALERARKELVERGAPPSAIDELVRRRLLHLEDRLDIQRVELTHDVLTAVVKKSRDERHQHEATLRAEQEARAIREKARRQRKRLRMIVAGMTVALIVVGGFGLESYRLYQLSESRLQEVERQRREAQSQKERAEKNQQLADQLFDEARGTVDQLLVEMSQEELKDIPGLQDLRLRFAQKAVQRYEAYLERRPDDPLVAEGHVRSLTTLGMIVGQIGSLDEAVATLERAIRLAELLVADKPEDSDRRFLLSQAALELGYVFWFGEEHDRGRPHLERAVEELETLGHDDSATLQYRLALVRAHNYLGNVIDDNAAEKRRHYEVAKTVGEELSKQHPGELKCVEFLAPPVGNLAGEVRQTGDYLGALKLEDEFLRLELLLRQRFPASPTHLVNCGLGYDSKARALLSLKRRDEAMECYLQSVDCLRNAAQSNPLVGRYQWLLADELRNHAWELAGDHRYADAEQNYKESCAILERLTQGSDDRAMYGTALIDSWLKLATFHQGSKTTKEDDNTRQAKRLEALDQAVEQGRRLSQKFPGDATLHFKFAEALNQRGVFDSDAARNEEAYLFFQECVDVFQKGVATASHVPTDFELGEFLKWLDTIQSCAQTLKRSDEVLRLADVAWAIGKACTVREGIQSLGTAINRGAFCHKEAGRYKEAVEGYSRALEVCRPALEKNPWHWYLRSNISGEYRNLAESYAAKGDFKNEVLAWREYLKVWSGPMQGMKVDVYLAPDRPTDEAEAIRLREFDKSGPGMKRFTVPCDFGGLKYPFHVYITNVPWPTDPLEDQARWLWEERGGTIPEEVRESFRKLHKIAHENNVNFQDLCVYALGTANEDTEKHEKAHNEAAAKIAALSEKLKTDVDDQQSQVELAAAYLDLASAQKDLNDQSAAIQTYEQCRAFLEGAVQKPSAVVELHERLGTVYSTLGELYENMGANEREKAFAMHQLHQDVFERLSKRDDAKGSWRGELLKGLRALGRFANKAFSPQAAAVWYVRAVEQHDDEAAKALGSLYLEHPEVAEVLPQATRELLERAVARSANDRPQIPEKFAAEVRAEAERKRQAEAAEVARFASECDELAELYAARGDDEEYRRTLAKAYELRGRLTDLQADDPAVKSARAANAARLAQSFAKAKQAESAFAWTLRATELDHIESFFGLADLYQQGIGTAADLEKAELYRYLGYYKRADHAFSTGRFQDALPDLKKVVGSSRAKAEDHNRLGMCFGKLGRWDEAIASYMRGVASASSPEQRTSFMLNLLEALIVTERPEEALRFVEGMELVGWRLPEGDEAAAYAALFHGFRAITLAIAGKDRSDDETLMHQATKQRGTNLGGWSWDEIDQWLKTTKLAPQCKAAIEKIVSELKGKASE